MIQHTKEERLRRKREKKLSIGELPECPMDRLPDITASPFKVRVANWAVAVESGNYQDWYPSWSESCIWEARLCQSCRSAFKSECEYIENCYAVLNTIREEKEADTVAEAIYGILADESFRFDVPTFKSYHRRLFEKLNTNIYHPGEFRVVNLTKKEPVLSGESVQYQDYGMIEESLKYDFEEEAEQDYLKMDFEDKVARITTFTSRIWQVHPFYEGNTRTTAVFIEKYLASMGYEVDNEVFYKHSREFRDALVLANYTNIPEGIKANNAKLKEFFAKILGK